MVLGDLGVQQFGEGPLASGFGSGEDIRWVVTVTVPVDDGLDLVPGDEVAPAGAHSSGRLWRRGS